MNDILEFLADLQHPEMYGWAVSDEVRKKAKSLIDGFDHDADVAELKEELEYYQDFARAVRSFMVTSEDRRANKFMLEHGSAWIGMYDKAA
jgi:hypothetical protein